MFMNKFTAYLLALCLLFSVGCGSGGEKADEPEEAPAGAEAEPYEAPAEEPAVGTEHYDFDDSSIPSLSRISSVKVVTVSEDPRDGFRVEISYTEPQAAGASSFIYQWKINGEEILGESGEELEWREGFRRGDTVAVSVIPYSDLGQGALSAEGSFTIPNSPPRITSEPKAVFEDGRFSYTVEAVDPDGDPLDFTLRGAPAGMTIEPATGLIIWEYGPGDAGDYTVTIIVSDSEGAESAQMLTFSIGAGESAPEEPY